MKKYVFILILFLLPCFLLAQGKKSIDGFMDIPFGSDSATVKAAVLTKGGIKNDTLTEKDMLGFSNFALSQRPVRYFFVKFVDNKAFDADFYFLRSDDLVLSLYNNLVTDITSIYGKPAQIKNFNELSNTSKLRKIRSGNIKIETIWQSKNKNTISIEIKSEDPVLIVILSYQDSDLFDLYNAKRRSDL
jgi:hypothetical protein